MQLVAWAEDVANLEAGKAGTVVNVEARLAWVACLREAEQLEE